ncbi:MAG: hypothetical protein SFX73_36810 [Kofleriaceae bacterium]|nr:hypothetical protein [Kofleriaceae bacterium]
MRLAAFALGLVCVAISVRPAEACGSWRLRDTERGTEAGYLINSLTIRRNNKRVGALYFSEAKTGLRVVKDRKVVLDIKDGKLLRYGKPIAEVSDAGVTFGKKAYTIELADAPSRHGMPTYLLTVKHGDKIVLTSDEASALCAGGLASPLAPEDGRWEVRRRVIYYLAWRERKA